MSCSIKLHRFITILFVITTALALLVIGAYIFLSYKLGNGFVATPVSSSTLPDAFSSPFPPLYSTNPTPSSTQLFLSTIDSKGIKVFFYDLHNHLLISERTIPVKEGDLGLSSYEAEGANDVVQYNPPIREILYATDESDGEFGTCINNKKSCFFRIFKVAPDATTSTIFFTTSTTEEPAHWLINATNNTLILSFEKPGQQLLKILDLTTGKVLSDKEFPLPDAKNTHQLRLSSDGKRMYQTYNEFLATGPRQIQNLYLREITLATGEYQDFQVMSDALALSFETTVSPDGKQLAFYAGEFSAPHLTVYDTQTKKLYTIPFQGTVDNVNLNWTGNGTRLLYRLKDRATLFDFSTRKLIALPTTIEKADVIWAVDQAGYNILYEYPRAHLTIYDKTTERSFGLPFSAFSLKGVLFF